MAPISLPSTGSSQTSPSTSNTTRTSPLPSSAPVDPLLLTIAFSSGPHPSSSQHGSTPLDQPKVEGGSNAAEGGHAECLVRLKPPKKAADDSCSKPSPTKPIEKFRHAALLVLAQVRAESLDGKGHSSKQPLEAHVVDISSSDGDNSSQDLSGPAVRQCTHRPWHKRLLQQVVFELMTIGESVCCMLTPAQLGHHWILFSPCLFVTLCFVFAFMAAQLPYWLAWHRAQTCSQSSLPSLCYQQAFPTDSQGPAFLLTWFQGTESTATDFTFDFLNAWGARYAPLLVSQPQRWLTSQFVHANFLHLAGNLAVLVALAAPLERRFGCIRVFVVWTLSVIGGGLLSAAVESPCTQVLGASAGIFSLLGMFAAEFVLERQNLALPIYRALMTLIFAGIFVGTVFTQPGVSHISHLGGFICGMLPTFLILPNKFKDTVQKALPAVGLVSVVVWFSVLPYWVYRHVLPGLQCFDKR